MFIVIQEKTQDFLDTPRGLGVGLRVVMVGKARAHK